jgi:hypothetical protein
MAGEFEKKTGKFTIACEACPVWGQKMVFNHKRPNSCPKVSYDLFKSAGRVIVL